MPQASPKKKESPKLQLPRSRKTLRRAPIGDDLDWIERAVTLGTFAAGEPAVGTLINMELSMFFKESDAQKLSDFWMEARSWIEQFVDGKVAGDIWDSVLGPQLLSIGQAVGRVVHETPEDQFAVYNGTIRTTCDQLRDTLSKVARSGSPADLTNAFTRFISIALVDLATAKTLIALDFQLGPQDPYHVRRVD